MKGKLPSKSTGITTLNTKLEKSNKTKNSNGHPSFIITTYFQESILYFFFHTYPCKQIIHFPGIGIIELS